MSEECNLSRKAVRGALDRLRSCDFITSDEPLGAQKGLRITLCNYELYQSVSAYEGHSKGIEGLSEGHSKGIEGNTNKNNKNEKNKEEEREMRAPEHTSAYYIDFVNIKTGGLFKEQMKDWLNTWGLLRRGNVDLAPVFEWAVANYDAPISKARFFAEDDWSKILTAYNKANPKRGGSKTLHEL